MVKQFLKMAGVKTQAEFYKKYPTEAAFFRAHPEAKKLVKAADGGSFLPTYGDTALPQAMYGMGMAFGGPTYPVYTGYPRQKYNGKDIVPALDWMRDGGSPLVTTQGQSLRNYTNTAAYTPGGWDPNHFTMPPITPMYDDGGMAPEQGGQMQPGQEQGGGGDQMQQVIQAIVQMLQQGMPPQDVVNKLVEMGIPQDQATQLVQAVAQKMQSGEGQQQMPAQGGQEEMAEGPQGQEAPQQEAAEGQPMGRYGGSYARGGEAMNSTYYQGMSYARGGSFVPEYGASAWSVEYAAGGEAPGNQLVMQVAQMLQQGVQPEAVLQQLVQAKIPKKKAIELIQAVMQQMQQGAAQQEQTQMAYGGLTKYAPGGLTTQTTTIFPSFRAAADNTRTMLAYNNEAKLKANELSAMRNEYLKGLKPKYKDLRASTGNFEDTPSSSDSMYYRMDFEKAPYYNAMSHPGSYYDVSYFPTELDYQKALNYHSYFDLMGENNPGAATLGWNTGQAYSDWQEQFKNKYYDKNGNLKKEYIKIAKSLRLPKKIKEYKMGGEYEVSHDDIQDLINKGYKIQYL